MFEATVERVVPGGEGLARLDGVVTLVPGGLPGDRLLLRTWSEGSRLMRGEILDVLEAGPARRPEGEVCPRARDRSCGGCDWPAARLEAHVDLKVSLVRDALRRIGGLNDAEIPEPRFVPSPSNYRLRNRLHLDGSGRLGFFGPRSNTVSDLSTCEIVSKDLLGRLPAVRDWLSSFGRISGELFTLEDVAGASLIGELRLEPGSLPEIALKVNRGPFDGFRLVASDGRTLFSDGPLSLILIAGSARFRVSVSSFFQGNKFLLDAFLEEVRSALTRVLREGPIRRAVDLYAGVGFLTWPLLRVVGAAGIVGIVGTVDAVDAVEIDPSASADLDENLRSWRKAGLPLACSHRTSAETFLHSLSKKSSGLPTPQIDVILADPPRSGLSPRARQGILRLAPRGLLLVSCDPATLARDLAVLKRSYALERLVLLDLFPGTHHVETLTLLLRRSIK
jgi:23S rRNA (uracil1939-C5)-methyltransferase